MRRTRGWEHNLQHYLGERAHMPFSWGKQDCCSFTSGALIAQGLPDLMASIPPYSTYEDVLALLLEHGLRNTASEIFTSNGFPQIPVSFAGRGFPILGKVSETPGMTESLGVVGLEGTISYFPGAEGLVKFPTLECEISWRVA